MSLLLASLAASGFAISKTQRFTIKKASDRHFNNGFDRVFNVSSTGNEGCANSFWEMR